MKKLLIALLILSACNGRLSDEQRKRLRDGMKRDEILRISEAQMTDAAFALGRSLSALSGVRRDSLLRTKTINWKEIRETDLSLSDVEKQIAVAYAAGETSAEFADNVQKIGTDSMLYTKPVLRELPDGSHHFNYALALCFSRRQIINSMNP